MNARLWWAQPLTAEAFAPYGHVIGIDAARRRYPINDGSALRHDDLARLDVHETGGDGVVAIVHAQPVRLPAQLRALERHRLGTQLFMPLQPARFLVIVATHESTQPFIEARCFVALPGQGVQYMRGTWHHPLLALDAVTDFLVVDRSDPAGIDDNELRVWPDAPCADVHS